MRSFTPHDAGTAPGRWREQRFWTEAPLIGLPSPDTRLVVLAAHADDETLGVGGMISAAGRHGHEIDVVVASDGRGSHPHSPTHTPERIARLRAAEAERAVAELAPAARVHQMHLPDGKLADHIEHIVAALARLLDESARAGTDTWLLSTWADDGHPDHTACALAARQAVRGRDRVREFEYPVWFWHAGDPARPGTLAESVRMFRLADADRAARDRALACYRSQTRALSTRPGDEPVLPPQVLAHFDRPVDVLLDVLEHRSADPASFDGLYADGCDPWNLRDAWYERRKRALAVAALPRERYRRGFEPGSARGDLSLLLLDRVDGLVCAETAAAAAAEARARLGARASVLSLRVPDEWPDGTFDLIVLAEVGYYLDLSRLADRITESLDTGGTLLLLHWRRAAPDHPHTAETVHLTLADRLAWPCAAHHVEAEFLLDVFVRPQADSSPGSDRAAR